MDPDRLPLTVDRRADTRDFLRAVALLLGLPLMLLAGLVVWLAWPYRLPADRDIFAVVAGTWDWAGAEERCVKDPHTISFSPDRTVMILRYREPWTDDEGQEHQVAEYDIQESSRRHIRGLIRGETRLTDEGEPVVWDLVLRSPDSYRWHRTDWSWADYTKSVERCEETGKR